MTNKNKRNETKFAVLFGIKNVQKIKNKWELLKKVKIDLIKYWNEKKKEDNEKNERQQ